MRKTSSGFTIVELLIVIVVIGILAAITIVAFNGIQERARTSAVQSALSQANKKLAIAMNDGTLSTYPADQAGFDALNISGGSNTTFQYRATPNSTSPTGYCITATNGTTSYKISETGTATSGACAGHGSGGVSAVTNKILNPSLENASTGVNGASYAGSTFTTSRITSGGQSGNSFVRGTTSTASTTYGGGLFIDIPNLKENVAHNVQFQVRSSRTIRMGARIWTYASTTVGSSFLGSASDLVVSSGIVLQSNQWVRLSATVTPAATTLSGRIILQPTSGTGQQLWQAGDTLDVDSIFVAETNSSPLYADGDSVGWDWNGTPHNSTSSGPPL